MRELRLLGCLPNEWPPPLLLSIPSPASYPIPLLALYRPQVGLYHPESVHGKAIAASRTAAAGFVMTCCSSLFFIIYVGTEREEAEAVKATKAETI